MQAVRSGNEQRHHNFNAPKTDCSSSGRSGVMQPIGAAQCNDEHTSNANPVQPESPASMLAPKPRYPPGHPKQAIPADMDSSAALFSPTGLDGEAVPLEWVSESTRPLSQSKPTLPRAVRMFSTPSLSRLVAFDPGPGSVRSVAYADGSSALHHGPTSEPPPHAATTTVVAAASASASDVRAARGPARHASAVVSGSLTIELARAPPSLTPQQRTLPIAQRPGDDAQPRALVEQQRAPAFQLPSALDQQPPEAVQQPCVAFHQSSTSFQQPGVAFHHPRASFQQPCLVYQHPSGALQQSSSSFQQPGVVYQQPRVFDQQARVLMPDDPALPATATAAAGLVPGRIGASWLQHPPQSLMRTSQPAAGPGNKALQAQKRAFPFHEPARTWVSLRASTTAAPAVFQNSGSVFGAAASYGAAAEPAVSCGTIRKQGPFAIAGARHEGDFWRPTATGPTVGGDQRRPTKRMRRFELHGKAAATGRPRASHEVVMAMRAVEQDTIAVLLQASPLLVLPRRVPTLAPDGLRAFVVDRATADATAALSMLRNAPSAPVGAVGAIFRP